MWPGVSRLAENAEDQVERCCGSDAPKRSEEAPEYFRAIQGWFADAPSRFAIERGDLTRAQAEALDEIKLWPGAPVSLLRAHGVWNGLVDAIHYDGYRPDWNSIVLLAEETFAIAMLNFCDAGVADATWQEFVAAYAQGTASPADAPSFHAEVAAEYCLTRAAIYLE